MTPEASFLNAIAVQLESIPSERRKEYFTQIIITEILDGKLGLSAGHEPEHARMVNAIKTILLESEDASNLIDKLLSSLKTSSDR